MKRPGINEPKTPSVKQISSPTNVLRKTEKKDFIDAQSPQLSSQSPQNQKNQEGSTNSGNVRVICRIRPFNGREKDLNSQLCVDFVDEKTVGIKLQNENGTSNGVSNFRFTFDRVLDMDATQEEVYDIAAKPVIESVLQGFNGTVFAYGQTGSGKTFTMQGTKFGKGDNYGIMPRTIETVFASIGETPEHIEFTVKVGIVEIYMEKIRDLLGPEKTNLKIREDKVRGVYIEDMTEHYVSEDREVLDLIEVGNSNRAISATNMNEGSSRSHMIFMMSIHQNNLHEISAKTGILYLVDLAGSEKVGKTGAAGQILEEAKKINKSLSALGNVINALTDGKASHHIPYRNSKLTRVLQESLGGNSRTTLIITCSPSHLNDLETLSTLRFGHRAKSIQNTPKINKEFTLIELKMLLEKAEKKLEEKDLRINQLEGVLKEKDISIPVVDEKIFTKDDKFSTEPFETLETNADLSDDDLSDKGEKEFKDDKEDEGLLKEKFEELTKKSKFDEQDRIKILEKELETQRNDTRIQTEKYNSLRTEFRTANSRIQGLERENEAMIVKLANLMMKMAQLKEFFIEKDNKISSLESLNDTLSFENQDLKKLRDSLTRRLEEKEEEVSRLNKLYKLTNSTTLDTKITLNGLGTKIESMSDNLLGDITAKHRISDQDGLKRVLKHYFNEIGSMVREKLQDEVKQVTIQENPSLAEKARLLEELCFEKELNKKLNEQLNDARAECDRIAKEKIPNFENLKQKIVEETMIKDKMSFVQTLEQQIKNREKLIDELRSSLNIEKDRYKVLEKHLFEEDKTWKAKYNLLEKNFESLTHSYQKLRNQKSVIASESQSDKKAQKFQEKILHLEKQLNLSNEQVLDLKKKLEILQNQLQEPITPSNNADEGSKAGSLQQSLMDDELEGITRRASQANSKIVKPIRGGSKISNIFNHKTNS